MHEDSISPPEDRNFDDIASAFDERIGSSLKGRLRREVAIRDLLLLAPDFDDQPRKVLDAGGGFGQISIRAALQGHSVTYCDLSSVMTARARAAAEAEGCGSRIRFLTQGCQTLTEDGFDLVCGHAMVEWTADPRATVQSLAGRVAPGGWLSLLCYNRAAHEFNLLRLGDFDPILSGDLLARRVRLTPTSPQDPEELSQWVADAGLRVMMRSGVRVFCDYMPKDRRRRHDDDTIAALELSYSRQEPFWRLGRYVHVLARRE